MYVTSQKHTKEENAMKRSKIVDRDSRRDALKGLAALGGAAAASTVAGSASAATAEAEAEQRPPETLGYRETDHIREYYRKARF